MTVLGNIKNFIRGNSPEKTTQPSTTLSSETTTAASSLSVATTTTASSHNQDYSKYTEILPRYKLTELIGEGAFSKVYKLFDSTLQKYIAIKIIDKSSMTLQQINSILKEISIMSKLNHDNVVKLYSFKNSVRFCYLMMELVPGGEIFNQIIKYTYFSENLARHVIVQVAHALNYLHEEIGVVHRDIKPENLLFVPIPFKPRPVKDQVKARRKSDDDNKLDEGYFVEGEGSLTIGTVKIADFGLSKILWNNNTKTPVGTQGYTAPEILKDESYDKSVDCFSLGCVLYTLLCGFPPFYDSDPKLLLEKVAKGEYYFLNPWWQEISQPAKDLVSNLLTVDLEKRYTIDQLLNDPWIVQNSSRRALKLVDYPTTTCNELLYQQFNNDTAESLLTPRLELIKFAFDTSNLMQLQKLAKPLFQEEEIVEEDEPEETLGVLDDAGDDEDDDDDDFLSEIDTDDSLGSEDDDDEDESEFCAVPVLTKTNSAVHSCKPIIHEQPETCVDKIRFGHSNGSGQYEHKLLPKTPIPGRSTGLDQLKPRLCRVAAPYDTVDKKKDGLRTAADLISSSIENFDLKLNASTMLSRRKLAGGKCGGVVVAEVRDL